MPRLGGLKAWRLILLAMRAKVRCLYGGILPYFRAHAIQKSTSRRGVGDTRHAMHLHALRLIQSFFCSGGHTNAAPSTSAEDVWNPFRFRQWCVKLLNFQGCDVPLWPSSLELEREVNVQRKKNPETTCIQYTRWYTRRTAHSGCGTNGEERRLGPWHFEVWNVDFVLASSTMSQ